MFRAYKYRLLPTDEQKLILDNYFGAVRFVYNLALETKSYAWQSARTTLSEFDLINQLPDLKEQAEWLKDVPAQSLCLTVSDLSTAFKNFFKHGQRYPRFKKRRGVQSFRISQSISINGSKIHLTKIKWVQFVKHRPLPSGKIKSATITKTPTGKYFVGILIDTDEQVMQLKPVVARTTVGIDVGLKSFAVLSDGGEIDNPKHFGKMLSRLRVEERALSRRFKRGAKEQSNNYHKQKLVVAKLHEKITHRRNDFLQKTSTAIVKQYDTICLEKLNVAGMMQNQNLSKAIGDAGWYSFNRMIEYKAKWLGKNVVYINRFTPSSKTCSSCETINKELKLSDRVWTCDNCGSSHDRDLNAAINIKNFGLRSQPLTANVSH